MNETWREVPGWPGYFVSDAGHVRGRRGGLLKQRPNYRNEYRYVSFARADGTGRTVSFNVHRLVLETFVGPRPDGMTASHLNGDKSNNSIANLAWEPHGDNMRRQREHGTQPDQRGERNHAARLTARDVSEVRALLAAGQRQSEIARKFGVSSSTISLIKFGHTWRAEA